MRLADTNIFIRFLIEDDTEEGARRHGACRALFEAVSRGAEQIATTEACLAEIVHVMTLQRHYGRPKSEALEALRGFTMQRGIRIRPQTLYRETLDVWQRHLHLSFEDAILAAHALDSGMELLSYDRGFDRVAGVVRVEPAAHSP